MRRLVRLLTAVTLLGGASVPAHGAERSDRTPSDGGAAPRRAVSDAGRGAGAEQGGAATGLVKGSAMRPQRGSTPLSTYGRLHGCGLALCSERGEAVQLRGISTHGIQWYGWNSPCLNPGALDSIANDWGADIVRIAMYVQEGGYATNPDALRREVETLVDETERRGLYALVDFHILTPGDPLVNLGLAQQFFRYMASRYGHKPNVLFEIANEPNGVPWSTIKHYAEQILPIIRDEAGSSAVTIVGTPDWSSLGVSGGRSPDDVVQNPPVDPATQQPFSNLMYTFHFYASQHTDAYRQAVRKYSERLPIFLTEWGTPQASGDGPIDEGNVQAWLSLIKEKGFSYAYWNWSDNGQTGSILHPGACTGASGAYTGAALQRSGQLLWDALHAP